MRATRIIQRVSIFGCSVVFGCMLTSMPYDVDFARYAGTWRLYTFGDYSADSIESRQRLVLRKDSIFTSTISLFFRDSRDTSRLLNPYTGRWKVIHYGTNQVHFDFDSSGILDAQLVVSGGRVDSVLHLTRQMHGDPPHPDYVYHTTWKLVP